MKFKVGDTVIVTGGKDKGVKSTIVKVLPKEHKVIVKDANKYVKHVKPMGNRAGEKINIERALPLAKIAIINNKDQVDRIGYKIEKSGEKVRIFKKTGAVMPEPKVTENKEK